MVGRLQIHALVVLALMPTLATDAPAQQVPAASRGDTTPSEWYRIVVDRDDSRRFQAFPRLAWGLDIFAPSWLPNEANMPTRTTSLPVHRSMLDTGKIRLPENWTGAVRIEAVASDSEDVARLHVINIARAVQVPFEATEADLSACVILARDPKHAPTIVLIHPPGPVVPMLAAGELARVARDLRQGEHPVNANIVILEDHLNIPGSTVPVRWMHHHWIDSPVNGAWRTALLEKLLPAIQRLGEGVLDPCRTVVVGHGPGAWAAWWLFRDFEIPRGENAGGAQADPNAAQVLPWADFAVRFDACILVNPEPFGFSMVELQPVGGAEGDKRIVGDLGMLLGAPQGEDGALFLERLRAWIRAEDQRIARAENPRPGLNIHSFERALSAQPAPERIMDRETGEFRPEVAKRWQGHFAWPVAPGAATRPPWGVGESTAGIERSESSLWCSRLWIVHEAARGMTNHGGNPAMAIKPDPLSDWGLGKAEMQTSGLVSLIRTVHGSYRVGLANADRSFGGGCGCLPGQ